MNAKQIRSALEQYTDKWIREQHPAERPYLKAERRKLESDLAEALARPRPERKRTTLSLKWSKR